MPSTSAAARMPQRTHSEVARPATARVAADAVRGRDPPAGLSRIGIDEISYQKGLRHLTVVVDHRTVPERGEVPLDQVGDLGPPGGLLRGALWERRG